MLNSYQKTRKQQGSVMFLTLIILLIFTISGLMMMDMAILEELAVSNEQRALQVYQTAHSELEAQIGYLHANTHILGNAMSGDQTLASILNSGSCSNPGDICQTVTLRYTGKTAPPAGYSISSFTGLRFEIDSIATLTGAAARSSQTMGFIYVAPLAGL